MAPGADVPDEFDVYTVVVLRRPAEAPELTDADPSVVAGRLAYDVMEWWAAAGSVAFPRAGAPVGERRRMTED